MTQPTALKHRIAAGAAWMILARWGVRVIGLASTVVLARLLTPADFGLVGLATLLYFLVQSASDFSLDMDLIRSQSRERSRYDTVWTLEVLRGIVNGAVVLALATPAAIVLDEPRLPHIALWIAATSVISGLANVGVVEFRTDLRFSREFAYSLLTKLLSFLVAMPAAFLLRSYWALVIGIMAAALARVVLSFAMHPYRPRFSLQCWREVLGFSKWLWFSSQLFFVRTKSDEFFVSKWAGVDGLGLYRVAREVAELPTSELITPMLRAVFPGFSRLSEEGHSLGESYLAVLGGSVMLIAPLTVGLYITADLVLGFGFGSRWLVAAPLLQLLALAGPIEMFAGNAYAVFVALGHPRYSTYAGLLHAGLFLLALVALVPGMGSAGAALALVSSTLAGALLNLHLVQRLLGFAWRDLARVVWRPCAAAIAMAALVSLARHLAPVPDDTASFGVQSLGCVVLGAIAYPALLALLWLRSGRPAGAESLAFSILRQRMPLPRPPLV